MKQPIRNGVIQPKSIKRSVNKVDKKRNHPKYGTSKLEEYFAHEFLDKLGVDYTYQFEAKDIGRFYDFRIVNGPIIEINGSYWHGDSRLYESENLNRVQKRNIYVDKLKEKWALLHGIPIYYIWEKDIKETPSKVMDYLKEILNIHIKNTTIKENRKKRH